MCLCVSQSLCVMCAVGLRATGCRGGRGGALCPGWHMRVCSVSASSARGALPRYGCACACEFVCVRRARTDTVRACVQRSDPRARCTNIGLHSHMSANPLHFNAAGTPSPTHRSFTGFRKPQALKMRTSNRSNTFRLKAFPTIIPSCL